jgi:hypothetical protein
MGCRSGDFKDFTAECTAEVVEIEKYNFRQERRCVASATEFERLQGATPEMSPSRPVLQAGDWISPPLEAEWPPTEFSSEALTIIAGSRMLCTAPYFGGLK